MTTAVPLDLDERVLKTLDSCLEKMADCLDKTFNPQEKQSLSLFRQFCSTMHSRMQWIKAMTARILQPNQSTNQGAKPVSPSQKPSGSSCFGSENRKNDTPKPQSLPPEPKINGLLLKR